MILIFVQTVLTRLRNLSFLSLTVDTGRLSMTGMAQPVFKTQLRTYAEEAFQATPSCSRDMVIRFVESTVDLQPASDNEDDDDSEDDPPESLIWESFMRVEHPRLSTTFGLNPVIAVNVPESKLRSILPHSKVLEYCRTASS